MSLQEKRNVSTGVLMLSSVLSGPQAMVGWGLVCSAGSPQPSAKDPGENMVERLKLSQDPL